MIHCVKNSILERNSALEKYFLPLTRTACDDAERNLSNYTALQALVMALGVFPGAAAGVCPVQAHTKTLAPMYNPYVDFQ